MKPTKKLTYINGLRAGYESIGATQRGQYSWLASLGNTYVFAAEIDHIDEEDNIYDHMQGLFKKRIRPLSLELNEDPATIRHAEELFEALTHAYNEKLRCHLMLVKGTKYGKTNSGIKSAVDGDFWEVSELEGFVRTGMNFLLKRIK